MTGSAIATLMRGTGPNRCGTRAAQFIAHSRAACIAAPAPPEVRGPATMIPIACFPAAVAAYPVASPPAMPACRAAFAARCACRVGSGNR